MKLEVNNLSCGYNGKSIISGLNLELSSGEICCILGENGIGKSTLFKTVLGVIPPVSGQILIDGEDINKIPRKRFASLVSYVAQSHNSTFDYSVSEIITMGRSNFYKPFMGPSSEDLDVVNRIAEEMGVSNLLDKSFHSLSGGEQQKVLICKALAQEPELIILDEPTANLDYGNQVVLLEEINKLAEKGVSVLFTTHNPEQALILNANTLILSKGCAPVFGEPAKVITEKTLNEAYGTEIRVVEIVDGGGDLMRCCIPIIGR